MNLSSPDSGFLSTSAETTGTQLDDVVQSASSTTNDASCPPVLKFCLSPRCPPDGAAFYEVSPPNSSVSSSPIAQSVSDLKSPVTEGADTQTRMHAPIQCDVGAQYDACIEERKSDQNAPQQIGPKPSFASRLLPANSTFCSQKKDANQLTLSRSVEPTLPVLSSNDSPLNRNSKPPSSSPSTSGNRQVTVPFGPCTKSNMVYPNQSMRPPCDQRLVIPAAECRDQRNEATCLPSPSVAINYQPIRLPPLAKIPSAEASSGDQCISSPASPPLPPPPPSPPKIPPRDPTTILQQKQNYSVNKVGQTAANGTISNSAQPANSSSGLANAVGAQTTKTNTAGPPVPVRSTAYAHEVSKICKPSLSSSAPNKPGVSSPSPTSREVDGNVSTNASSPFKHFGRQISLNSKESTAKLPESVPTYSSLPSSADPVGILDGRTVVPWKAGHRNLAETDTAKDVSTVAEAVAAALAPVSVFSSDTPQWIPPSKNSNSLHITSSEATELSPITPVIMTSKNKEGERVSECEKVKQPNTKASRPSCLSSSTSKDRVRVSAKRYPNENPATKTEQTQGQLSSSDYSAQTVPVLQTDYTTWSTAEMEWWRAQQRSERIATGQTRIRRNTSGTNPIGGSSLYHRQFSAGPSFNTTPSAHPDFSPTHFFTSQIAPLYRDAFYGAADFQTTPTNAAGSARGNLPCEMELALVDERGRKTGSSSHPQGVQLSPVATSRFMIDPRTNFITSGYPDSNIIENQCGYNSSMTQSVLFPPNAGWSAPNYIPVEENSSVPSSGRRKRLKHGVMRSQSHRAMDQTKSQQFFMDSEPEPNRCVPSDFYQRSVSQTVPSEAAQHVAGQWPPIAAQWHHRRQPMAPGAEYYGRQYSDQQRLVKARRAANGRSSNDLSDTRQTQPHHHHSASAIFECLEKQPWFHFNLSRAGAEKLLNSTPVGGFLVRQSETCKSEYSLSIRRETDFLHMKISQDPTSGQYVLGEYSQPYPSVTAMIYRYTRSLLPVRGTTPVLLRFPVCRRKLHPPPQQSQPVRET
ncbi:unnamed protein product [Calicophoron daubneyi]